MHKGWIVLFVVLCSWWTYLGRQQSFVWQSNSSLWEYQARLQPYDLWVQQNYATALLEAKRVADVCVQLGYIQKLAGTDHVVNEVGLTPAQLDAWLVDRMLGLAYLDYKGFGVTTCRDDHIFSVASR